MGKWVGSGWGVGGKGQKGGPGDVRDGVTGCSDVGEVERGNGSAGQQAANDHAGKRPAGGEREEGKYDRTRATYRARQRALPAGRRWWAHCRLERRHRARLRRPPTERARHGLVRHRHRCRRHRGRRHGMA